MVGQGNRGCSPLYRTTACAELCRMGRLREQGPSVDPHRAPGGKAVTSECVLHLVHRLPRRRQSLGPPRLMCRDQAGLKMKALCFSGTDPQEVQYHPPHPRLPVSSRRYLLATLLGTKNSKKKTGKCAGSEMPAPTGCECPSGFTFGRVSRHAWEAGVLLLQMGDGAQVLRCFQAPKPVFLP